MAIKKRKTIVIIVVAVLVAIALAAVLIAVKSFTRNDGGKSPEQIIRFSQIIPDISPYEIMPVAKRGLCAQAPENTLQSIELAAAEGFAAVSFDVRETRDGIWVLLRDEKINTMTDGRGKVSKLTYYEILMFTINNGANIANYPDTKIPTLEDGLLLCRSLNLNAFIRVEKSDEQGLSRLVNLFTELGREGFTIVSPDKQVLEIVRQLSPETEIWFENDSPGKKDLDWLKLNGGMGVVSSRGITDKQAERIKDAGLALAGDNIDSPKKLKKFYDYGTRVFFTDSIYPG